MPPASLMFALEEVEGGSVRVNWLGQSEVSAKDLLATPQDQEHADARSEAVEFLKDILADGPVPAKQVVEEADDAEIAEKTLRRAKKILGVIAYRENTTGEKRGAGRWMWKLPMVELIEDDFQGGHQDVQDGHTPLKQNGGHLEECGHGYPGGKGCYLCDADHPHRKNGSAS